MLTTKKVKRMDNYTANKIILRRLHDLVENSQEVGFQKILHLSGCSDLFEIAPDELNDDETFVVSGGDVHETSLETLNKMNLINN